MFGYQVHAHKDSNPGAIAVAGFIRPDEAEAYAIQKYAEGGYRRVFVVALGFDGNGANDSIFFLVGKEWK